MSEDTLELNRRRVLGGLITLGGAGAAAGAGTFAYFTDNATSTDNEIVAGTLQVGEAGDAQLTATDLAPGERVPSSGTTTIEATYDAASTFDPAELDFSTALTEPTASEANPSGNADESASSLAGQLSLETATLSVGGTVVTDFVADSGFGTLADFDGFGVDDVSGGISPGDTVAFDVAVTMDTDTGNAYQGDGVSLDVTFTVQQSGAD